MPSWQTVLCPTDRRDEDYVLALVDGAFAKALEIRLVRKVNPASAVHSITILRQIPAARYI